jgi:5-methylcytosine-specific restriction protein B
MLVDLSTVANECKAKYENLENKGDLMLTPSFKSLLKKTLTDTNGGTVEVNDATTVINNNSLPHSWLWYAHTYWEFYAGISEYDEAIKEIEEELKKSYPVRTIKDFLKKFPSKSNGSWDWNKKLKTEPLYQGFKDIVDTKFAQNTNNRKYLEKFLSDFNWRHYNKQISRSDIIESAAKTVLGPHGIIQANVAYLPYLISAFNSSEELRTLFADMVEKSTRTFKTGGKNIIFYGPPGTGKSAEIKRKIDVSPNVITVFHPDMQNSDFIGALKPAVDGKHVTYKFSPGPFAKALLKAYEHPDEDVYLVIEELNRAPAMSVFGELFQLLDRKVSGASEYGVGFPSDEFREWLDHKTNMVHVEIRLPSNLSIYASMNTADQGVYPLDTAFRRRWDDEYIFIDWDNCPDIKLAIFDTEGSEKETSWKLLGSEVNKVLLDNNHPEDRLLGQWWINEKDVSSIDNTVPNKLLNYLWNDLLRHDVPTRNEIFKPGIKSFSTLIKRKNLKKQIFSDMFLDKLVS